MVGSVACKRVRRSQGQAAEREPRTGFGAFWLSGILMHFAISIYFLLLDLLVSLLMLHALTVFLLDCFLYWDWLLVSFLLSSFAPLL